MLMRIASPLHEADGEALPRQGYGVKVCRVRSFRLVQPVAALFQPSFQPVTPPLLPWPCVQALPAAHNLKHGIAMPRCVRRPRSGSGCT